MRVRIRSRAGPTSLPGRCVACLRSSRPQRLLGGSCICCCPRLETVRRPRLSYYGPTAKLSSVRTPGVPAPVGGFRSCSRSGRCARGPARPAAHRRAGHRRCGTRRASWPRSRSLPSSSWRAGACSRRSPDARTAGWHVGSRSRPIRMMPSASGCWRRRCRRCCGRRSGRRRPNALRRRSLTDVLGAISDASARHFLSGRFRPPWTAPVADRRAGVARRPRERRPGRVRRRARARGACRAARRVAPGDGAIRGAPDVSDVLSAVHARGSRRPPARRRAGRIGRRRADADALARRDPACRPRTTRACSSPRRRCGAPTAPGCTY